jgi:hypothetical protein
MNGYTVFGELHMTQVPGAVPADKQKIRSGLQHTDIILNYVWPVGAGSKPAL